jgi:hypothetical protein
MCIYILLLWLCSWAEMLKYKWQHIPFGMLTLHFGCGWWHGGSTGWLLTCLLWMPFSLDILSTSSLYKPCWLIKSFCLTTDGGGREAVWEFLTYPLTWGQKLATNLNTLHDHDHIYICIYLELKHFIWHACNLQTLFIFLSKLLTSISIYMTYSTIK